MALQKATTAGKAAKGNDLVQEAVTNLIAHVSELYQVALKENDQIYHERVPSPDDLSPVQGQLSFLETHRHLTCYDLHAMMSWSSYML